MANESSVLNLDNSFDEKESGIDLTSVIAEFPEGDDHPGQMIPIKKLSEAFEGCIKSDEFLKVFLRVRPINNKLDSTIVVESENSIITTAPDGSRRAQYTKQESRNYIFSKVFGPNSSQNDVYEQSTLPLLNRLLLGDNCVLFAYGMTNAGKTHTIQGSNQDPGILPKLISSILAKSVGETGIKYDLHISMLEIYQEKIYDLLGKVKEKLSIRDCNGRVEVNKLSNHSIYSVQEALRLMDIAAAKRSKSTTCLNTGSSRSHAVYTLTISHAYTSSAFHLVDLAGAERGNRTKATLIQQKEANNINMSLMQLWRCLQGMRKANTIGADGGNNDIIPFRESKLTHLLMPILSKAGAAGVALVTCVNPQPDDYDETLSILGNASIASKIREITDLGRNGISNNVTSNTAINIHSNIVDEKATLGMKRKSVHQVGAAKKKSIVSVKCLHTISGTAGDASETSVEVLEELGRLRQEVVMLRKENSVLQAEAMSREAEIRLEVSNEMSIRGGHLLEQIQELREQLAVFENSGGDVTGRNNFQKSAKKVRKRQLDLAQEETSSDLREAEEELERVKNHYDLKINELMSDKERLETELRKYTKSNNQTQPTTTLSLKDKLKSVEAVLGAAGGGGSISFQGVTANEFAKRFQKNNENSVSNYNSSNKTNGFIKSPNRSPLSPVSNNISNSPVNSSGRISPMKRGENNNNNQNNKPVFAVKRVDNFSPQRIRPVEESTNISNGNGNYITRLRSNYMKM